MTVADGEGASKLGLFTLQLISQDLARLRKELIKSEGTDDFLVWQFYFFCQLFQAFSVVLAYKAATAE